ncbi:unnamed protein product [Echinostoma caproni]|uniref:SET domain-containing protein n=1 Tax=Echinostoma caproni TaxID=27848 RepID=A0A183B954_9TREM|nr:unnamed protein product [Echinostoma caproni]
MRFLGTELIDSVELYLPFYSVQRGWGIRALHAIPKGTFLCTYAGAIYDESTAVQQGFDYGDEYQAELDYIETVEKPKDGYESMPEDPDENNDSSMHDKPDPQLKKSQSTPAFSNLCDNTGPTSKPLSRPSSAQALDEMDTESRADACSDSSSLSDSIPIDCSDGDRTPAAVTDLINTNDDSDCRIVKVNKDSLSSTSSASNSTDASELRVLPEQLASPRPRVSVGSPKSHPADSPEVRRAGDHPDSISDSSMQNIITEGELVIDTSDTDVDENRSLVDPTSPIPVSSTESPPIDLPVSSMAEMTCLPASTMKEASTNLKILDPSSESNGPLPVATTASTDSQDVPDTELSQRCTDSDAIDKPQLSFVVEKPVKSGDSSDAVKLNSDQTDDTKKEEGSVSLKQPDKVGKSDKTESDAESNPEEENRSQKLQPRPKRTCVKARSKSVPREFWSLYNARHLLDMVDFDRVPVVQLIPLSREFHKCT